MTGLQINYNATHVNGIVASYSDSQSILFGYTANSNGYAKTISLLNRKITIVRVSHQTAIESLEFCFDTKECTGRLGGKDSWYDDFNLNDVITNGGYDIISFFGAYAENVINQFAIFYTSNFILNYLFSVFHSF